MTNTKFCDIHPQDDNSRKVPSDQTQSVIVEKWMKVKGKNRLFENRLDACASDIQKQIFDRAIGLKVDIQSNWKTQVWQVNANGKKYKTMMTMDEYLAHLDEQAKKEELAELRALRATTK